MPSAQSKGDAGDIDLVDIPYVDSAAYDWPSDEGYVLRHLTDFSVIDAMDQPTDLTLTGSDESSGCVTFATGYLVPPKSSSAKQRLTTIPVTNYAIDFGNDENRGFWLVDRFGVWYKLIKPSEEYKPLAQFALEFTKEFIKLVDVAVYNKCGGQYAKYIATARKYSCLKTMEALHEESGHYFDIDVLRKDLNLLYHRLSTVFTSSCGIMKALGSMVKGPKDGDEHKAVGVPEPKDTKELAVETVSNKDPKGKTSKGSASASDKIEAEERKDSKLNKTPEALQKGKESAVSKKSGASVSSRDDSPSMEVSHDEAAAPAENDRNREASSVPPTLDAAGGSSSSSSSSRREASKLAPDWLRSSRPVQTIPVPVAEAAALPPSDASTNIKPPSNLIKKKKLSGDKLSIGMNVTGSAAPLSESIDFLNEMRPLEIGQIFRGKVLTLEPYGAFVSLPSLYGVGMVRTRQISHFKKIAVPSDILKKGDQIYVKVVEIVEKGPGVAPRIGLSMKYADQRTGADLDPRGIAYQRDVGMKPSSGGANSNNKSNNSDLPSSKASVHASAEHLAPAAEQRDPRLPAALSAGPVTDAVELALKSTESFDLNKFLAAKFIIEEQIAANLARLENRSAPESGAADSVAAPGPAISAAPPQPERPAGRGRAATLPAWMTADKKTDPGREPDTKSRTAVRKPEASSEPGAIPSVAAARVAGLEASVGGGRGRAKTLPAWMTDKKVIDVPSISAERDSGGVSKQSAFPTAAEGDVAIVAGAGGGRGKAKTLPAWMTQGGAGSSGSSSLFNQLKGLAEKMAGSNASGKPLQPFQSTSSSSSAPSPSGGSKRRRSRSRSPKSSPSDSRRLRSEGSADSGRDRDRDRERDRREKSGGRGGSSGGGDWGRRRSRSRSPSPHGRSRSSR